MKKKYVYPVAFAILVLISLVYKFVLSGRATFLTSVAQTSQTDFERTETNETEMSTSEISEAKLEINHSVYICGAVNNPGVYEVTDKTILNDVVTLAGGLTTDAATDRLNLVYEIRENVSIYIPSYNEIEDGGQWIIDSNSGDLSEGFIREDELIWGEQTDSTGNFININTADKSTLMNLPGIGESLADAIIEYRSTAPFSSIEDVMNVPGIGEGKYNQIKDLITV